MNNQIINTYKEILGMISGFEIISADMRYVTREANFDSLKVPTDHEMRKNVFVEQSGRLYRTHLAAHYIDILKKGVKKFVLFGEVFRREERREDKAPIYHHMDIVSTGGNEDNGEKLAELIIEKLLPLRKIIKKDVKVSFAENVGRLSIVYNGKEVELLGYGKLKDFVFDAAGLNGNTGYAISINLDRVICVKYNLSNISTLNKPDKKTVFKVSIIDNEIISVDDVINVCRKCLDNKAFCIVTLDSYRQLHESYSTLFDICLKNHSLEDTSLDAKIRQIRQELSNKYKMVVYE